MPLNHSELANALHVIECIVLSERLTITPAETAAATGHSDTILEWLEGSALDGLVRVEVDAPGQMIVAASVAREMRARNLLAPLRGAPSGLDHLDLTTSLPAGVDTVTGEFWSDLGSDIARVGLVRERAESALGHNRQGALFAYGLAQHDDILDEIACTVRRGGLPDDLCWSQMNVIFRALVNQQMADRIGPKTYAPPPARAKELRVIWSRTLDHLDSAASEVAIGLHNEMGDRAFAEDLLDTMGRPLPLVGLACVLEADAASPHAPAPERLCSARALARPLRDRFADLEELFAENPGKYLRALSGEQHALIRAARRRFGTPRLDGVGFQVDCTMTIDQNGAPVFGLKAGGSVKAAIQSLAPHRRRRVSLLSDGIARTVRYGSLEHAVRHALRP